MGKRIGCHLASSLLNRHCLIQNSLEQKLIYSEGKASSNQVISAIGSLVTGTVPTRSRRRVGELATLFSFFIIYHSLKMQENYYLHCKEIDD